MAEVTVVQGDTLNKIAAANNITLSELLKLNPGITNPDLIHPGDVIALPGDADADVEGGGGAIVDPTKGVTDVEPVQAGQSIIPQGGRIVIVKNPKGSDEPRLIFVIYEWQGVDLAFEIGGPDRFRELFGLFVEDFFTDISTTSQEGFDTQGFVLAGSIDQELGATESIGSRIERETRALGLEDLPPWLSSSSDALALIAEGTTQGWSAGRLWTELSKTSTFQERFGGALDIYLQGGQTIAAAVDALVNDESTLQAALRSFQPAAFVVTTEFLQGLLLNGWTPTAVAQVLEQAATFRSDPGAMAQANAILEASGLGTLDEVGFLNAMNGFGPPEIVEALNTAAAGRALSEAGLDDVDIDLLMDVVDTSDRLLTADSFRELAQQLSFNLIRFGSELDFGKLGITEEDVIASAFGREAPSGKSSGEVLNLLARFQRDRQAAGGGFEAFSAFQDQRGRLRVQGLAGL